MENQSIRVLLVEDDIVDRKAFQKFAKKEQLRYRYMIAGSVTEAKKIIRVNDFDIVVSDFFLSDGDALEILDFVTSTPVIIVTGAGDEETAVNAMKKGAFDYLVKDSENKYLNALAVRIDNALKHKKTEEILAETQQRFKLAVEGSRDGLWYWHIEDENKHWWAPRFYEILGYGPDDFKSTVLDFGDFLHPADKEMAWNAVQDSLNDDTPYDIKIRLRKKSGDYVWVRSRAQVQRNENGKALSLQGSIQDLTDDIRQSQLLKESEERYRDLFENASDLIQSVAMDGKFMFVNKTWKDTLGYTDKEISKLNFLDIIHKDDRKHCRKIFQNLKDGVENIDIEVSFVNKSGKKIIVEGKINTRFKDGKPFATRGIFRDITNRKRAEKTLDTILQVTSSKVGEEFLEMLVSTLAATFHVKYGFITEQVPDNDKTGKTVVFWANGKLEKNFEYKYTGTPCERVMETGIAFYPDNVQKVFPKFSLLSNEGIKSYLAIAFYNSSGRIKGHMGIMDTKPMERSDLAESMLKAFTARAGIELERKNAEEALRESEHRFKEMADLLPSSVFETDINGNYTYINRAGFEESGYGQMDLEKGLNALQMFVPEERKRVAQNIQKTFKGKEFEDHEYTALKKDGTPFPVYIHSAPIFKNNKPAGLRGIVLDISERKKTEEENFRRQQEFMTLVENSPDAIIRFDKKLRHVHVNPKVLKLFGVPSEELVGKTIKNFGFPKKLADYWVKNLKKAFTTGKGELLEFQLPESIGLKHIQTRVVPEFNEKKEVETVMFVSRDITEIKQAEELKTVLYNISQATQTTSNLDDLYPAIRESLKPVLETTNFIIMLYDKETNRISCPYYVDQFLNIQEIVSKNNKYVMENSLSAKIIRTGKPIFLNKAEYKRLIKIGEIKQFGRTPEIWLGVPLKSGKSVRGAVIVQSYTNPNAYSKKDIKLLGSFSTQIAGAIERKSASDKLRENQERLTGFMESATDLFTLFDENLNLVEVNKAAIKILKRKKKDLIGKNILDLIPGIKDSGRFDQYLKVLETGKPFFVEDFESHPRLGKRNLSLKAFKVGEGLGFIITDITKLKNTVYALKESKERIDSIVDNVVDAIITIDEKGTIETVNKATKKLFGYKISELIGKNIKMLMPEKYINENDFFIKNYVSGGESHVIGKVIELAGRKKNGSMFPIDLAINEMWIDDKRMFTGIIRDITERKDAQNLIESKNEKLNRLIEELRSIDKLKSTFVSTVSHELRTPLTSIKASIGLVLAESVGVIDKEAKQFLKICYSNTDRLIRLINDLLDLSRLEEKTIELSKREFDMNSLVEEVIWGLNSFAEFHSVSVVNEVNEDININADRDRIAQVLNNLMSNGIKFSGDGNVLNVKSRVKNGSVEITIADRGKPIPDNIKEKIFERFFQADGTSSRKVGGTGLGLAISKSIIEQHGGKIWVENRKIKGNSFKFTLPGRIEK